MIYQIEEIVPEQDQSICQIIKSVGAEYGAVGDGFGPSDLEVLCMSQHYGTDSSIYYVATVEGKVIGGGGISAFNGSHEICELRKLFLLSEYRGQRIGEALARRCLDHAKTRGYTSCYLDTLSSMEQAISLYKKLGFQPCNQLEGQHSGCDVGMIKHF